MNSCNYPKGPLICGAKTRTGGECKQPPMPNGRCRYHGGMSLSGKNHGRYVRGKYTKDALANRRELRAMRKSARLESLTWAELYGLTNNIDRCGCIADHWLVGDILLRARRTYDAALDIVEGK